MYDLTFSSEFVEVGLGRVAVTRFSDSRLERINSYAQYMYVDPTSEYVYIYFELFQLYRCIVKYTYNDQQLDVEVINNSDHEVLLKTDDLEFAVETVEELYIETIRKSLS